ncbi:MAG: hypothetical protein DHS80DRAFT_25519 [Piptocephalis tieghemiana]|nr:MAG: hypothetical protein DHS80DRAFT_25519 [Piptocephalis tieghemiana]
MILADWLPALVNSWYPTEPVWVETDGGPQEWTKMPVSLSSVMVDGNEVKWHLDAGAAAANGQKGGQVRPDGYIPYIFDKSQAKLVGPGAFGGYGWPTAFFGTGQTSVLSDGKEFFRYEGEDAPNFGLSWMSTRLSLASSIVGPESFRVGSRPSIGPCGYVVQPGAPSTYSVCGVEAVVRDGPNEFFVSKGLESRSFGTEGIDPAVCHNLFDDHPLGPVAACSRFIAPSGNSTNSTNGLLHNVAVEIYFQRQGDGLIVDFFAASGGVVNEAFFMRLRQTVYAWALASNVPHNEPLEINKPWTWEGQVSSGVSNIWGQDLTNYAIDDLVFLNSPEWRGQKGHKGVAPNSNRPEDIHRAGCMGSLVSCKGTIEGRYLSPVPWAVLAIWGCGTVALLIGIWWRTRPNALTYMGLTSSLFQVLSCTTMSGHQESTKLGMWDGGLRLLRTSDLGHQELVNGADEVIRGVSGVQHSTEEPTEKARDPSEKA